MEELQIDLEKYKEIPESLLKKLSGEKLLKFDVLDQNGNVIFTAGHAITNEEVQKNISSGKRFFVPRVSKDETEGTYKHEIIGKESLQEIADNTVETYSAVRETGKMTYEQYLRSNKDLITIVEGLKTEDRTGGVLSLLKDIEDFDYYTYAHSVNVGVLAMIFAYKTGYNKEKIQAMSLAGYLHDIGKLRIPREIIRKSEHLSKEEYYRCMEHTRDGYRILDAIADASETKVVPKIIKLVTLFHHRKLKNYGYPFRDQRDRNSEEFYINMPEEVKFIGICDIYDAVTSKKPYKEGLSPAEGLKYILNLSSYYFTTEDIHRFLRPMVLSLNKGQNFLNPGDYIMLESVKTARSEKETKIQVYEFAKILKIFKGRPTEPVVKIFYDATGNKKVRPIEVDLRHDHLRKVVRTINSKRLRDMLDNLYPKY